jgi:hypothetical protein
MKIRFVLTLLIGLLVLGITTNAAPVNSTAMGSLVGRVVDASEGAAIKYAFVLVHRGQSQEDVKLSLDSEGRFSVRLAPGFYDVFITADGFTPTCKKLAVTSAKASIFNASLRPDLEHSETTRRSPR